MSAAPVLGHERKLGRGSHPQGDPSRNDCCRTTHCVELSADRQAIEHDVDCKMRNRLAPARGDKIKGLDMVLT